ncbi:Thioredoxin-like 4 [Arachis hypogaea]|nr:Thioredoxin-like 4 [Arachis hypogaea]
MRRTFCPCSSTGVVADEHQEDFPNVNEDLCPVDCVREFTTDEEFCRILDKAKGTGSFVIVDFYRTSRGSCKYIEQGFAKLCKKAVMNEYDEQSEVAERLRIKVVPLSILQRWSPVLEAFPTKNKEKIVVAILKYSS